MEETITISRVNLLQLCIKEERLNQLEINGVDNWMHYGCMCSEREEPECIFCTEDEEAFLDGRG